MNTQLDEVWELLYPRVTNTLLKGYCNGLFNPQKDKFFAATFVTDFPAADDLQFLMSHFNSGYSIISKPSGASEQQGWHALPPGAGLQPAECNAYSISFHGAFYEDEWHFISSLIFFVTADEELAKDSVFPADVFSNTVYLPYQSFSPSRVNVQMLEFSMAPWLVADVKQTKKEKLNQAFRYYLELAVLQPLAEKLRIYYPYKYDSIVGMYGTEHFSSIFPANKRLVLLVTGAKGLSENDYTIRYLLYMPEEGNIYEWEYFPVGIASFYDPESVINQLKTVTYWDNPRYLQSSCTLDDDHFWKQCVIPQEEGEYKYLRELTFAGNSLSLKL
ncbi:hypothetical protein [Chitinophaga filiformis]|uniref:Uncharacterized protein n=1 Tax=Chitinophaga filiformis TaxID=104663 RepID=A0A1G7SGH6_CHIFI|nr:hypothetical protein [Chitinophaga filiformis]SDG22103.1 hypothetical protein SAMN04488121_103863 [Chitinophaga filiformis]